MFSHTEVGLVSLLKTSVRPSFTVFLSRNCVLKTPDLYLHPRLENCLARSLSSLPWTQRWVRKDLNASLSYTQCFSLRSVMVRAEEVAFLKISGYQHVCCLLSFFIPLGNPGFIRGGGERKCALHCTPLFKSCGGWACLFSAVSPVLHWQIARRSRLLRQRRYTNKRTNQQHALLSFLVIRFTSVQHQ